VNLSVIILVFLKLNISVKLLGGDEINIFCRKPLFRSLIQFVGFEVLTAMAVKSSVFWDMAPCSLLKVNQQTTWRCIPENRSLHTDAV
jgi:hypothetical protein